MWSDAPKPRRLAAVFLAAFFATVAAASADEWYEHYARAEKALEEGAPSDAVAELNEALAKKGDPGARVRTYGMRFTEYFPYLLLGRAYLGLGQLDAAREACDTEERLGEVLQSKDGRRRLEELRRDVDDALQARDAETERRITAIVDQSLTEAKKLEAQGLWDEALTVLGRALAVAPGRPELTALEDRLRRKLAEREEERLRPATRPEPAATPPPTSPPPTPPPSAEPETPPQEEAPDPRRTRIAELLATAQDALDDGRAEDALQAANRVLALEPGNAAALETVGHAYRAISQALLGAAPRENLPPAIRFADFRDEAEDGSRVERVERPDFRLSGVVIDDSPTMVTFSADGLPVSADVRSHEAGGAVLTEWSLRHRLEPGTTVFRLAAQDPEGLASSAEYAVTYRQPFYRSPLFAPALGGSAVLAVAALLLHRLRRRRKLRRRRYNPYLAGPPVLDPDLFLGREELIARILQTIHNNSLLLHGERRIGKTSILHQLKKRLESLEDPDYVFYPAYVDLQGTPEEKFFAVLGEEVFHELESHLGGLEPGDAEAYGYRELVRDLKRVLSVLKEKSGRRRVKLVLLIDEVDELNDYDPKVNQKLRSLFMKGFAEDLAAVVSGVSIKKSWRRETSPWYNFFEEIEVRPLRDDDARKLVLKPIRGLFKTEEDALRLVLEKTGGKPYLVQKLCMTVVNSLYEEGRKTITVKDVEDAAQAQKL